MTPYSYVIQLKVLPESHNLCFSKSIAVNHFPKCPKDAIEYQDFVTLQKRPYFSNMRQSRSFYKSKIVHKQTYDHKR